MNESESHHMISRILASLFVSVRWQLRDFVRSYLPDMYVSSRILAASAVPAGSARLPACLHARQRATGEWPLLWLLRLS